MVDALSQFIVNAFYSLNLITVQGMISDTFTLIAGFVAIGIPLSLQVIQRASEKYKSQYLISHLSRIWFISPQFLIGTTLVYVFLSMSLKYVNIECSRDTFIFFLLGWSVVLIFSLLIVSITIWYFWVLKSIKKNSMELFDELSQ